MRRLVVPLIVAVGIVSSARLFVVAGRAAEERVAAAKSALDDGIVRIVILGDSVARGAGDERQAGIAGNLAGVLHSRGMVPAIANFGVNGARSRHVLKTLSQSSVRSAIRSADIVIVSIGGNDLYGDSRARLLAGLAPSYFQELTVRNVAALAAALRGQNPAARIYLLGLYNPYKQSRIATWIDQQVNLWDSRLIQRFADWQQVTVVRTMDLLERPDRLSTVDHFHPGSAGYAAIASRIASSM